MVADEYPQTFCPVPFALVGIAVMDLEGLEVFAKDSPGTGQEAGAVLHLLKLRHIEMLALLADVHQSWMAATRDAL